MMVICFWKKNNSMLHFTFYTLQDGNLSDFIYLNSRITQVEAVSAENEPWDIELSFNTSNANTLFSYQLKIISKSTKSI